MRAVCLGCAIGLYILCLAEVPLGDNGECSTVRQINCGLGIFSIRFECLRIAYLGYLQLVSFLNRNGLIWIDDQ